MKNETKTLSEYKAPKCKMVAMQVEGLVCSSLVYKTGGEIESVDEEDLGTL